MVNFFGFNFGKKTAKRHTADFSFGKNAVPSDKSTLSFKNYLQSDPDLAANVRRFVDNIMIESPRIVSADGESVSDKTLKRYNSELEDVRFYKLLRAAIYHLIWNGNAFFEIKYSGKKLREMYNIDPETIDIKKTKDGGEVIKYVQQVDGSKEISLYPEEVIHITIDNLDSGVWGKSFIKSLKQALLRKDIAEYYLQWLIQNNKFKPIINVQAEMQEDVWNHIVSQFNANAVDPNFLQIINTFPDDKVDLMRIFTTDDFDTILKYIDEQKKQIMTLLQVPPIIAGTVDNSNRSNSEIQARMVFYNTIKAFQNLVAEELNFEMLRKLEWKSVKFKFPEIDKRSETDLIKIAKSLRQDLHFTEDAVLNYLEENGFKIPKVKEIFDKTLAGPQGTQDNNNDTPSRAPRDKGGLPQNEALRKEDKAMGVSSNAN